MIKKLRFKPVFALIVGISIVSGLVYLVSKLPENAPPLKRTSEDSLYLYSAGNKTFKAQFGNKETKTPQVEFSVLGENDSTATATFTMLDTNTDTTNPQKKGKVLTFENVKEDMDLRYETLPNGIKEEIVLNKKTDQNTFQFTLDIDNAYPEEITKGFPAPTFYDAQGNYLFHFEKPYAYDEKGERTDDASIQVRKNNKGTYRILVSVDKEWLVSEDRVYPIYIDPTIVHDTSEEFANTKASLNRATHSGDTGVDPAELVADDSTVLLLHMNEGSDNTCSGGTNDVCDSSIYGNDGAFNGDAAHTTTAKLGSNATTFDGTGDYIRISDDDSLDLTTYTIQAWIKPSNVSGNKRIVEKGDLGDQNYRFRLVGDELYIAFNDSPSWLEYTSTTANIVADEWTHVAAVVSAASSVKLYKNGQEVYYSTTSNTPDTTATTVSIGIGYDNSTDPFIGQIDEVAIHNRALPTEEIRAAYSQRAIHTTYQELPADEHTVGLWHMNNDWLDSSGNSNDGTASGNSTFINDSKLGSHTGTFDGTGDHVSITDNSTLDITEEITIEAWVNVSDFSSFPYVVSKTTGGNNSYGLIISDANIPRLLIWDSSTLKGDDYTGGETMSANTWHHVAGVYDGKQIMSYLDGNLVKAIAYSGDIDASSADLFIAARGNSLQYLNGQIDEVRISNIARTPEEIKASASRRPYSVYTSDVIDLGAPVKSWTDIAWSENGVNTTDGETLTDSTSLVAHWKFNETSGTTADNAEGTAALDGTLTNMTTSGQDAAAGDGWTADNLKWGAGALMFDGTDGYVSVSDNDSLSFGDATSDDPFSIEAWVNLDDATSSTIFAKQDITNDDREYAFMFASADTLNLLLFDDVGVNQIERISAKTFTADEGNWIHVAATYDGSGQDTGIKLYQNGIELPTTSGSSGTYTAMHNLNETVTLGTNANNGANAYFDGTIDSIRIYSRALTQQEILSNYNASNLELQTRVGRSSDPNDGTWEAWKDTAAETQVTSHDGPYLYNTTDSGLVSYWPMDEASWTNDCSTDTVTDVKGTNEGDACPNSTGPTGGIEQAKFGKSGYFDGSNDYINIGDTSDVDFGSGNFAIELWAKKDIGETQGFLVGKDACGAVSGDRQLNLYFVSNAVRLSYYKATDSQVESNSSVAITDNNWHHIFGQRNGNDFEIYIDGQLSASGTLTGTHGTMQSTSTALELGRRNCGGGAGDMFAGHIDEVRIYNTAQTAATIQQHYLEGLDHFGAGAIKQETDTTTYYEGSGAEKITTGAPQVDGNTVALWHLDETNGDNAGDDIFDETTNNNDGEFGGSNIATAVVDGISGKARTFNGSDDGINVGTGGSLSFGSGDFSVCAWTKYDSEANFNVIAGSQESSGNYRGWYLRYNTDHKIAFAANYNSGWDGNGNIITDSAYADPDWHHVCGVLDGGNSAIRIYYDGKEVKSGSGSNTYNINNSEPTYIGRKTNGEYFNGSIDEVHISNVARTAEEIAEEYRAGRDHYINKTITSDDLSGDTTLSYYVAADRPGTYMESMIGESAYANYQPDANTVGLWHLDEGTDDACNAGNDDVCDASGNGNHLDGSGSSTPGINGKLGQSRNFESSNSDYLNCSDANCGGTSGGLDIGTSNFTISQWIKTSTTGAHQSVVYKGDNAGANDRYMIRVNTSNVIQAQIADGTNSANINGATTVADGNWHHIVFTDDGSNVKLYVDGMLDGSTSSSSVGDIDSTQQFAIGVTASPVALYFDGDIDEVRVDMTNRSADEIRQAYEIGRRSHPVTIDFAATLDSGDLIADSDDKSFIIDSTTYGAEEKGDNLYPGDQVIVRETIDDTEYIAQATVSTINRYSGEVNIGGSWTTGSTFPSGGFTANASVFKWQREYMDLSGPLDSHINATTNLTLRLTDGHEGRTVWLDDMNTSTGYASTNTGSTISSSTGYQFMQYRIINTSSDETVSANLTDVTIDYVTRHPESHWKFDEGYGTTAYDQSTNSNNGTLTNGPSWTQKDQCMNGFCLEYDGTDDYTTIADDDSLDFAAADDFSIGGWFRHGTTSTSDNLVTKKISGNLDTGDGTDGSLTPTGTFNLNSSTSGGRSYADGIAYKIDASTATGSSLTTSDTVNGITTGDEVLLINLQGASGDTADVGNYEFLEISSVSGTTVNFTTSIQNSYDGTTPGNQKVVIQRIPNYTSVTLDSSDSITATAWDGLTTTPTGAVGYYTGIVAFRTTGTVTVASGTSISANSLGYSGGTGGVTQTDGGNNGESYDGSNGRGGNGTSHGETNGGGKSGNGTTASPNNGGARGGGGGGGSDSQNGNGNSGAGGGGGGAYGGGGGGGASGTTNGTPADGGSGGNTSINGGGGGGASGVGCAAGVGGNAGSAGGNGGCGGTGGQVGSGSTTGSGGGGDGASSGSGAGGGGGGYYGDTSLNQIFHGSGGAGGGGVYNSTSGMDGGAGGGIIFIEANTITATSGTISANGEGGNNSSGNNGAGGGGAGGSVFLLADTVNLGTTTSSGGNGGAKGTWRGGGGGAGGVGRIAINYFTSLSGSSTPTASSTQLPTEAAGYSIYMESDGDLTFGIDDDTTWGPDDSATTTTADYDDNEWHHFTAVKDGTTSIKLYIDGNEVASDTSIAATGTLANTGSFKISTGANGWEGFIDEVKVYRYARSVAEIKQDYIDGAVVLGAVSPDEVLSEGLILYWKMDETVQNTCTGGVNDTCDSSGNGYDAGWYNQATTTTGKYGAGTIFDGAADYVSDTDGSSYIDGISEFTTAVWVKADATGVDDGIYDTEAPDGNDDIMMLRYDAAGASGGQTNVIKAGITTTTGSTSIETSNQSQTTSWQHIVTTWKSGESIKVYIDGKLDTLSYDGGAVSGTITGSDRFMVGRGPKDGSAGWDGSLDEMRIYNRALSEREVRNLYNFAPGPVAHWKFDENTGIVNTYDSSGNGKTGTLQSMTEDSWVDGKFGSALEFDGSADYVNTGTSISDFGTSDFSVSAWINLDSFTDRNAILSKGVTNADDFLFYTTNDTTDSPLSTLRVYSDAGTLDVQYNYASDLNTWKHVAVTKNSTTAKLYVDGVLENTDTNLTGYDVSNAHNWIIGAAEDGTERFTDGSIDDVKIYNYARTQKQIVEDMNAGHPSPGSPIGSSVGWWKFDEGADNTCSGGTNDVCNSGSEGTALDAPITNASWSLSGKAGKAIEFDGTTDYITVGDKAELEPENFTLSFWAKTDNYNREYNGGIAKGYIFAGGANFSYTLDFHSNSARFYITDSSDTVYGPTTTIGDNNWHLWTATFDGSTAKLYKDGRLANSAAAAITIDYTKAYNDFTIGARGDGTYSFDGLMDEIKFYSFALTQNEVLTEYNSGKAAVFGSLSTASDGSTADFSSSREYCIPGDTSTCNAPVGEWKLDENTGTTTTYDTSANSNNGTLTSITESSWVPGKVGSALTFDGSADYIDVGDSSVFDFGSGNFSIEAWVKRESYTDNDTIVGKDDDGDANRQFMMQLRSNDVIRIRYSQSGGGFAELDSSGTITDDNWHHIVGQRNGDSFDIYIDGQLDNTGTSSGTHGTMQSTATNVLIGQRHYAGAEDRFQGVIDQVRIYDYARTPAQVAWSYNQGAPIGWWRFDENTGTTAYDASGNSNNGTLTNMDAATDWVTGKRSEGLDFDGTDDYVDMGSQSDHNITDEISVSSWVKFNSKPNSLAQIIGKYKAPGSSDNAYRLAINSSNQAYWTVQTASGDNHLSGTTAVNDNAWHHLMGTYDGSTMKIYVDGKLQNSSSVSGDIDTSTKSLKIGRDDIVSGTCGSDYCIFQGIIDDVRIYNYALTAKQIQDSLNGGAVLFD